MRVLVCLGLLALVPPIAPATATEAFGFRGLELGTTLADVRRTRYPEAPSARVVCLHEAGVRKDMRPTVDHVVEAAEMRAGVSSCGIYAFGKALPGMQSEWLPASIKINATDVRATFWIVPDTPKGNIESTGRLYRIAMRTNTTNWPEIRAAFVRRYGQPTTAEKSKYSSGRVNSLDNETVTWRRDDSMIRLVQRSGSPTRMMIVFQHNGLTPRDGEVQSDGTGIPTGLPSTSLAIPE